MLSPGVQASLLIFARAPTAGAAKTRLIPLLGAAGAARLQARLTRRALTTALAAGIGPVQLWGAPDAGHPFFSALATEQRITLHAQCAGDLGSRMRHAASQALGHYPMTLLMGTDCPLLLPADLRRAVAVLRQGRDAVLIPAEDGGYVLLGLTRLAPGLFHPIDWGTDQVLAQTRAALGRQACDVAELSTLPDLDRPEDALTLAREWPELWASLTQPESLP